jgi:hypothetical protein
MGYLLISYLLVGLILMLATPRYLKKRGVQTVDPAKALPYIIAGEGAGLAMALMIVSLWPVLVPMWIWSEFSADRETRLFAEKQKAERERLKTDPYASLSFDEKLDALRKIAEDQKKEPNQPLQHNASTGSVSNLKSPARRG